MTNSLFFEPGIDEKIDNAFAQVMPHFLGSGWYFNIEKK